jgi:RNA-directed DNA polymerase
MSIPIDNYKKNAKVKKHSKGYIKDISAYASNLKENNLPVIFSITHLAQCLEIKPSELLSIAEYGNFFDIKRQSIPFIKIEIESKSLWKHITCYIENIKIKINRIGKKEKEFKFSETFGKILPNTISTFNNETENYYYDDPNEYNIINSNYKFFKLNKKKGGHREIMAPKGQLKNIQKWINHYILKQVELHSNCFGFVPGRSIKGNALKHINQECILNLDLLKFFDTITQERVFGMFKQLGYHPNLARLLASLTTARHKEWYWDQIDLVKHPELNKLINKKPKILPQGAPTSPAISNILCRRLDNRLYKLAIKLNCSYSRYADDITFSGKKDNLPSLNLITKIINEEGFYLNKDKIGHYSKGSKQYVTGLNINDGVRVPRKLKREIKQILHYCKINGIKSHIKNTGIEKKHFKEWLEGNIAFIHDIEPEKAKIFWSQFNELDWE